jgi:hypothetical protein
VAPDIDIQIYGPVDGNIYLPGTSEPVFYLCNPGAPTVVIVSCVGSQHLFETINTSFAGSHEFTVTATDLDGRQATKTVTYTVPDFTAPTIELRTPADIASYDLGSSVTVDYECDDGHGSGIQLCGGTLPDGAPLDTTQPGTFTFEVATLDNANNLARTTVTYSIVDPTPAEPTIASPAEHAVYAQDQQAAAAYTCAGSVVTSCAGSVLAGSAIDTATVGEHTFTVTASNGQLTTATSHSYTVIYDFSGFFVPVAPLPTINAVKAGEGVPIKFSLGGDRGSNILAPGSPSWSSCGAPGGTAAFGRLSYNASLRRYTFLVETDRSWAGSCADLTLALRDGTTHRARFTFR